MIDMKSLQKYLRCPCCHSSELSFRADSSELKCDSCGTLYPIAHGRPALLRPDNAVFCLDDYRQAALPIIGSAKGLQRFIPEPSVNLASERLFEHMRQLLAGLPSAKVLVVGGGCQRAWLDGRLGASDRLQLVYSDIDVRADVDLFCDGHELPFTDGSFDAVITTAVLEHVLYPEQVAAEIHRVLRVDGLLYSELPFMQQVHEGAYDFTRYTLSGHRRLFNGFAEIDSGMVAGPATALVWSIENFVLAFLKRAFFRKMAKVIVRIFFAWLKHFDRLLVSRPEAMDGASCTYLFGRKIEGYTSDTEIIARYVGAKHLRHT
jgi:SAM-dependent methyltransferase